MGIVYGQPSSVMGHCAKTIHYDPCPAGWRVPQKSEQGSGDRNATAIPKSAQNDGGVLLNYDDTGNKFYIRFTGYPPVITQLNNVGLVGYATAGRGTVCVQGRWKQW